MIKSDYPRVEEIKERIKPATKLIYMEPYKRSPIIRFRAERFHSKFGMLTMTLLTSKANFRDVCGVEAVAGSFEEMYQHAIYTRKEKRGIK